MNLNSSNETICVISALLCKDAKNMVVSDISTVLSAAVTYHLSAWLIEIEEAGLLLSLLRASQPVEVLGPLVEALQSFLIRNLLDLVGALLHGHCCEGG